MKKRNETNNRIDEMLELKLLKTERTALYIAVIGLLIFSVIQIIFTLSLKMIVGEVVVTLTVCTYVIISCLKNGIWSGKGKPTLKSNLLVSLVPSVITLGIASAVCFINKNDISEKFILAMGILTLAAFVLTFILLEITGKIYEKKRKQLDNEDEKSR